MKKLVDKIDPETRTPMLDREGKVVKEEKEITVPDFKVITVFDISQTEGKEFPDLSVKPLLSLIHLLLKNALPEASTPIVPFAAST